MRFHCRLLCTMSSALEAFFAPPSSVRGMRVLDKAAFVRKVTLPAIFVQPPLCSKFHARLQHVVLKYPRVKRVHTQLGEDGKEEKVLLLMPETCLETPISEEDLKWIADNGGRRGDYEVTLEYQHYSAHTVLSALLPPETKEIPAGFEMVGHIAHLNLRKEVLPYKAVIGQVVLDQQSSTRTVVNKTDNIDNTFRFFKMELLAGEDNMVTTVHENGCSFTFDFSKVYWNSRLHTEHERAVAMFERGEVVVDVFAGVGPFAIPACKKGCIVYANDLNPSAYESLVENSKRNRVAPRLHAFNLDGREFLWEVIPKLVASSLNQDSASPTVICSHVIMNLPAIAVEFLDTFKGLFQAVPHEKRNTTKLPMVHCYCFSKSEDPDKDSRESVERYLGSPLEEGTYSLFNVREVAPNKVMMRVSFRLPPEVAFSAEVAFSEKCPVVDRPGISIEENDSESEPCLKRARTE